MVPSFPFINSKQSMRLLRTGTALVFFLHALVRIINGSIPQFARFMNEKGFMASTAIVWLITVFEIGGSILLALNIQAKCVCAGFILLLIAGIILIHAPLGWFVGEHGAGGTEYSFLLVLSLIAIAADKTVPVK